MGYDSYFIGCAEVIHAVRRLLHPVWRQVHLSMLPPWSAVRPWLITAMAMAVIVIDLCEREELLQRTEEMRASISIANRVKQCLEGRRTLGGVFDENGNPAHILCDIKFTKEAP